jgi:hypothetical protein
MVDPIAPKQPQFTSVPRERRIILVIRKEMLIKTVPNADKRVNTPNNRLSPQASSMNGRAHPNAIASGPGSMSKLYTKATE